MQDNVPPEAEIRQGVWKLHNGHDSGASGIRAENIKGWLRAVEEAEKVGTYPGEDGYQWALFVQLIQLVFEKGEIPSQMLWVVILLLSKGNGEYQGIGLIEPF